MRLPASLPLLLALCSATWSAPAAAGDLPLAPCLERSLVQRERARLWPRLSHEPDRRAWPGAGDTQGPADYVIVGHEQHWDANGIVADGPDTLIVPPGARVRWHRSAGLHTITDGRGLDDPESGRLFDYLLDDIHADFDTTFGEPDTISFFCAFHDPEMRGVLVISANASVDPDDPPVALRFSRPPIPNPSRSGVSFAVGLPQSRNVELDVRDVQGRQIARLHRGELAPGEHVFRWRGALPDGSPARAGVYFAWLTDGSRVMARRFTLLR